MLCGGFGALQFGRVIICPRARKRLKHEMETTEHVRETILHFAVYCFTCRSIVCVCSLTTSTSVNGGSLKGGKGGNSSSRGGHYKSNNIYKVEKVCGGCRETACASCHNTVFRTSRWCACQLCPKCIDHVDLHGPRCLTARSTLRHLLGALPVGSCEDVCLEIESFVL